MNPSNDTQQRSNFATLSRDRVVFPADRDIEVCPDCFGTGWMEADEVRWKIRNREIGEQMAPGTPRCSLLFEVYRYWKKTRQIRCHCWGLRK